MIIQAIINIAEICAQHGVAQAVICPGSRSAALALAFARHPQIDTFVVPDERSAAFIALGLAQSSDKSVAIVCTSGTAAANLYPAIIEAYYQQVPLLVFTADRPPEWIDQLDGQTIRQKDIFQNHVRKSYQFPVSFEHQDARWHAERMVSEAIVCATTQVPGPVHINVPIREPFYPAPSETFQYSKGLKIIKAQKLSLIPDDQQVAGINNHLASFSKIMLLVGQQEFSLELIDALKNIQKHQKWVVVGEIFSNIHALEHVVAHHDIILGELNTCTDIKPDLLITFGKSVLSKQLKSFLRHHAPGQHWHIGQNVDVVDTFATLTTKVLLDPKQFLGMVLAARRGLSKSQNAYFNLWKERELQAKSFLKNLFLNTQLHEFQAMKLVLEYLPDHSTLHLANSMPVRYANYLGLPAHKGIEVWANRGTSGIDGCTSTAVGHALNTPHIHTLVTGDMAFFYDRNALWHHHLPANIRIVLLNNHGGGIFRLINGPRQLEELEVFLKQSKN